MYNVCITGAIGSGKTTVSRLLEQCGARRLSADEIATGLTSRHSDALRKIVEAFGPASLDTHGALNRPYIADRVFHHAEDRMTLNAIVHPLVRRAVNERILAEKPHRGVLVVEVPLLAEGMHAGDYLFDCVVVVDCDPRVAAGRIKRSRHLSAEQINLRMRAQSDRSARNALADILFDNTEDISTDELQERVGKLYDDLVAREKRAKSLAD